MSYLSQRSENNQEVVKQLISGPLHVSSIHCSYYSCVQLMKHILLHKKNMKERDISRGIWLHKDSNNGKGGLHEYIISYFADDLDDLDFHNTAGQTFYDWINDLKTFRVSSDYQDVAISQSDSQKAWKLSKQVLDHLSDYYDL